MSIDRKKKV